MYQILKLKLLIKSSLFCQQMVPLHSFLNRADCIAMIRFSFDSHFGRINFIFMFFYQYLHMFFLFLAHRALDPRDYFHY